MKVSLILKGVQTWEDALEAYDHNLAGVVLSNHGGRQLDFARSGIEVLVEVTKKFKEKRGVTFPNDQFQLFVDGGVRRATDVLKAIALGATAGASPGRGIQSLRILILNVFYSFSGNWEAIFVCVLNLWHRRGRSCPPNFAGLLYQSFSHRTPLTLNRL